ncbi:hypothetical protein LTR66_008020 [Elasticomyces elasticus]|nr:hypothetical protein LTR66_008020 [Elasticomyces elasticus]
MGDGERTHDATNGKPPPFNLTAIDHKLLAMKDEDFHELRWDDLKDIIGRNDLEGLKRRPSDLRRYLAWSTATKEEYGSMTNFVLKNRLHWTPLPSTGASEGPKFAFKNPTPFADPDDFRILINDWPYGLAPGIVHLCIWTKTPIAVDERTGDLTKEARGLVERFVTRTFAEPLTRGEGDERERVLWFKNWVALQSVRGVDHVHVLVRDPPLDVLERWISL